VSPVKYELGSYIPEDDILDSHHRENLKSYILFICCERITTFETAQYNNLPNPLLYLEYLVHICMILYNVTSTNTCSLWYGRQRSADNTSNNPELQDSAQLGSARLGPRVRSYTLYNC
jgi:hypothetical protein